MISASSLTDRFDGEELFFAQEKLELFTLLLDRYMNVALLICDTHGKVVWANSYAKTVADKWGIFTLLDHELILTEKKLLNYLYIDALSASSKPVGKYFSSGHLFFEVSRLSSLHADAQLVGLIIDCHALENCGNHSLDELSPAEYRLLKSLEGSCSLKQAAGQLNISYENARTKLKSIFDKLDVHSQRELLQKVRHLVQNQNFMQ